MTSNAAPQVFKPFLVESDPRFRNIFRVNSLSENVTREQVEKLLENLPIRLYLKTDFSLATEGLLEPLEVEIKGKVVSIYPPEDRVFACVTLDSWENHEIVSKMHIDNMPDMLNPGNGQIRSCIHFDPAIFGIEGWDGAYRSKIEVDIFVFPKNKESEKKPEPPTLDKFQLSDLLELIAGGKHQLELGQLRKWRELIMYCVDSMRLIYGNCDIVSPSAFSCYQPCWQEIDAAAQDDTKLIAALETLRQAIEWE